MMSGRATAIRGTVLGLTGLTGLLGTRVAKSLRVRAVTCSPDAPRDYT
jgi:hypothetical protein